MSALLTVAHAHDISLKSLASHGRATPGDCLVLVDHAARLTPPTGYMLLLAARDIAVRAEQTRT
jgi:hypothetical protein